MPGDRLGRAKATGQALTESILLMPIFLLLVFALLQIAQLGIAIVLSQYAASSVARKMSSAQALAGGLSPSTAPYLQKVNDLMVVGMQYDGVEACVVNANSGDPTGELIVAVRAKLEAWPFFSTVMDQIAQNNYNPGALDCKTIGNVGGIGPVNFSAQTTPAYFYATGKAKVRLNYVP